MDEGNSCMVQFCRGHGLCNRLRGWAGLSVVAKERGVPLLVDWKPCRACPGDVLRLFEPDTFFSMTVPRACKQYPLLHIYSGEEAIKPSEQYLELIDISQIKFEASLRQLMLSLKPNSKLLNQIDSFMADIPGGVIGLHVRRTDHSRSEDHDPMLFELLDSIIYKDENAHFVLCADNQQSIRLLIKRYGGRIHWRSRNMRPLLFNKFRSSSAEDAVIDLFSLSQTSRIIGTSQSSFSYFAASLGGIPIQCV